MWGFIAIALLFGEAFAIWPLPVSYTTGSETLFIDQNVKISYKGASSVSRWGVAQQWKILLTISQSLGGYPANNASWTEKIVTNAIERTYDTLFHKNFVPWKFHPVGFIHRSLLVRLMLTTLLAHVEFRASD